MSGGNDQLLTLSEASKITGYSEGHLSLLIRRGLLAGQKQGKTWLVPRDALEALLAKPQKAPRRKSRKHTNAIECIDVLKDFHLGRTIIHALRGVTMEVRAGEYVILFGPSGCGKSTILHVIAGLEPPTSGRILVRGKDISHLSKDELARYHRTKIGLVFQQFAFLRTLNALENLLVPRMFTDVLPEARHERARHLLEIFNLSHLSDQLPQELSGGEQQRLAIARALVNNPWILLIDEPTGNLDSRAAKEIMGIIFELNNTSHRTILLVTHNPDYLHYAHRVLYMKDGMIVGERRNRPLRFWTPLPRADSLREDRLEQV